MIKVNNYNELKFNMVDLREGKKRVILIGSSFLIEQIQVIQ